LEKELHEMQAKPRALFYALLISMCALFSFEAIASSQNKNPDRSPRTQGVEPDAFTRMKLAEIVERHAAAANIPADFVRAVIRVESDWDADLTGFSGEIGLMQIKPETARDMGFRGEDQALYDPETNIRWGVAYLAAAYKLAAGDLCQTVLKYNVGHQATKMTDAASAYCGRVRTIMASN
jgi:soluble lytic murein transglycosylase-like protein